MKWSALSFVLVSVCVMLWIPVGVVAQNDTQPSAFLPETNHEFPPVLEGAQVVHDFIIQNRGAAELKVTQVRTG
jgi:hypothetical protein